MESYLLHAHYDLVTPDGVISEISDDGVAKVEITGISPAFVGFQIEPELVTFNLKSTLAQLGLDARALEMSLDAKAGVAEAKVQLKALCSIGAELLKLLGPGMVIGKLFAADPRRKVRDPDYLLRMLGRSDRRGRPLLSLGGMEGSGDLVFEVIDGRTVAYLRLQDGVVEYDETINGLLPTIARSLAAGISVRNLLSLHQSLDPSKPRLAKQGDLLLVKTAPLHVRTVFGAVVEELLPQGFLHTTAHVLQPDTSHSGDIYELFGNSTQEISDIPLEFFTLEPHREHVFYSDRDQLQATLENPKALSNAFRTAPPTPDQAAVYVVKGTQLKGLKPSDWVAREAIKHEFPGQTHGVRQAIMVQRYIEKQAAYPFLRSMEDGLITSQGVLLTRYFPSPVLKRMLLSDTTQHLLQGIYFQQASRQYGEYFSYEDRALLIDLAKFAIPTYWVDPRSGETLQFVQRPEKDAGMFVPPDQITAFLKATFFGIYGSNLSSGEFEPELRTLLEGISSMRFETTHPLLNAETPLAMVTGGGPGAMEVGNRVAQSVGYLSCANIVDFSNEGSETVNEQQQNPYVSAKMTYRLDKLVERQAEFHLDFPIFLQGGIGTDFEFALEEVGRKVGAIAPHPILLFGEPDYWKEKITSRYQCNLETGTIKGSEWVSNSFFCVKNAQEGLEVYRHFFNGTLPIGPTGPAYPLGFGHITDLS